MRNLVAALFLTLIGTSTAFGKVVVFWQEGFPTVASQPVTRETLIRALEGMDPVFTGIEGLREPATLTKADLLVLPYGSAMPADAWGSIQSYLRVGGNLLVLGGQPLRIPVTAINGNFNEGRPQDTYSRELDIRHAYEVPLLDKTRFAWKSGYSFFRAPEIRARRFFALEGRFSGLGYMMNSDGIEVAAPVVVADHTSVTPRANTMLGSRVVMLDFEPEAAYWESPDGIALVHAAADYARQGATSFWLEMLFSTLRPGETPQMVVHLRNARRERLGVTLACGAGCYLLASGLSLRLGPQL